MLFSQLGAKDRFVQAANYLMLNVTLSSALDSQIVSASSGPNVYIQKADRQEIFDITVTAGKLRAASPEVTKETDLDCLFAPFLSQLEPFIRTYGTLSQPG